MRSPSSSIRSSEAQTEPQSDWAERALAAMRQFFEAMDKGDEEAENDAVAKMYGLVEERRK